MQHHQQQQQSLSLSLRQTQFLARIHLFIQPFAYSLPLSLSRDMYRVHSHHASCVTFFSVHLRSNSMHEMASLRVVVLHPFTLHFNKWITIGLNGKNQQLRRLINVSQCIFFSLYFSSVLIMGIRSHPHIQCYVHSICSARNRASHRIVSHGMASHRITVELKLVVSVVDDVLAARRRGWLASWWGADIESKPSK